MSGFHNVGGWDSHRSDVARERSLRSFGSSEADPPTFRYGPGTRSSWLSRFNRNLNFWRHVAADTAALEEAAARERAREEERRRISEANAEKMPILSVKHLDLHISSNAVKHNTIKFDCVKGKDACPVLRRGQEFTMTVTFDRSFDKEKDDLHFVLTTDDDYLPVKNLTARFQLNEDNRGRYRQDDEWGAKIISSDKKTLILEVYIPGHCPVGEWDLKVKTKLQGTRERLEFEYPQSLIILFNPWSAADQVHFTEDKQLLKEYVLNSTGIYFSGTSDDIAARPWTYGQFQKGILQISLSLLMRAFNFVMTANMGDPIAVSRALSSIVNTNDDRGVLIGKWGGGYADGTSPSVWDSSVSILRQYEASGPVKYGQCWVFSLVLTTDASCTIDVLMEDDIFSFLSKDSIWNFHVWNEVWILRPQLPGGVYDGWHVIDATPQERSDGKMQCGPCPVKAVKRGDITVGYDTTFVFSEVNTEVIQWAKGSDGDLTVSKILTHLVGQKISTKFPDIMKPDRSVTTISNKNRMDITHTYKYEERSKEEREAVARVVKYRHRRKPSNFSPDLEVSFDTGKPTVMGQDLILTLSIANVTRKDKEVGVIMSARSCKYWNQADEDEKLLRKQFPKTTIRAGKTEKFQALVPHQLYLRACDEQLIVFASALARELRTDMPFTDSHPFRLQVPDLAMENLAHHLSVEQGPKAAMSNQPVMVKVTITNPLSIPLTKCRLTMDGDLDITEDDRNPISISPSGLHKMKHRDLKAHEKAMVMIRLVGQVDRDEGEATRTMNMTFCCSEFRAVMTGAFALEVSAQ